MQVTPMLYGYISWLSPTWVKKDSFLSDLPWPYQPWSTLYFAPVEGPEKVHKAKSSVIVCYSGSHL